MLRCCITPSDFRIRRVLSKIGQNPAVNIQDLAGLVNLSRSRLGHLFKTEIGVELRHFLIDARLEKAVELLRETDMQVKEISHTIGYHHVSSFDRVFRRRFKVAPARYRKQGLVSPVSTHFEPIYLSSASNGHSGNG